MPEASTERQQDKRADRRTLITEKMRKREKLESDIVGAARDQRNKAFVASKKQSQNAALIKQKVEILTHALEHFADQDSKLAFLDEAIALLPDETLDPPLRGQDNAEDDENGNQPQKSSRKRTAKGDEADTKKAGGK